MSEPNFTDIQNKPINVVWFKRDLRLSDNDALYAAVNSDAPLLLLYIFEPSLIDHDHYDTRHWRFVQESLADLNLELAKYNTEILVLKSEVIPAFQQLLKNYKIQTVFSTEETGLDITFTRDIQFSKFCKQNRIDWKEFQNGGVKRGLKNRDTWRNRWYSYMTKPIQTIEFPQAEFLDLEKLKNVFSNSLPDYEFATEHQMQKGGRTEGKKWEDSFFNERLEFYSEYISKPEMSRYGCSRLSPYFAWGCISIREVYQRVQKLRKTSALKRQLSFFSARLRWQAHFIQKFEMEPRIEFEPFNKGYLQIEQPENPEHIAAWKSGQTGFPLEDASMRAVAQTGYLNFRMRTMCVSFLLHHLFQNFRTGSAWLAKQFLDFEPGIHYGQFQMQSGFTATNTIRVYNPTKNAQDHDPEAVFIKSYLPELAHLPPALAIEPWNMTDLEQELYNFKLGRDYPERIVDIKETRAHALEVLYGIRKNALTQAEKQRILKVHTLKRRDP